MSDTFRRLSADLKRSRAVLLPPAFQFLWETPRYLVAYGGRASGKSWSIARVLLTLANEAPLRVLCAREIQGSIRESAYRLLADQIQMLELGDAFDIQADNITGKNGSKFFFEGLRYNASRIQSYEGIDLCWVEEAQRVSDQSWETLIPTVLRKPGSRFVISFNPTRPDDPVYCRFVEKSPPGTIARKVSYKDNPHFSAESEAARAWLEQTDPDAHRHVWLGAFRTVSDALILKGKFESAPFDVHASWAGPYHGMDFGFARDPSAAVRCYVDDSERILYVDREYWQLGCDIDALPDAIESAIPGISRHTLYCDSARPESINYLARHGVPNARSVEKWPGSVDDGIAYLRQFSRIVIDPSCTHLLDECVSYSFKTDRLTGVPLPEPEDKNNHLIDCLRYAISPLIRSHPSGGYFNRAALLVGGEPVEPGGKLDRPARIFMTLATCERPGTAVGLVYWAHFPHFGYPLRVLGYELVEIDVALDTPWLVRVFARAQELRREWDAPQLVTGLWIEAGELHDALAIIGEHLLRQVIDTGRPPEFDVCRIDSKMLSPTLDERIAPLRHLVNSEQFVKLARSAYAQQTTHRSVTTNHLLAQLLGYRPGARDASAELANAFAIGCQIARADRTHAPAAAETATIAVHGASTEPEPPAAPSVAQQRQAAYITARAAWDAEAAVKLAAIRAKLGNPTWKGTWRQLGMDTPPPHPPGAA